MEQNRIDLSFVAAQLRDPVFDRVLVACHRSPDGDACGSAFALAYALRTMGKQARVFCPDRFGAEFSFITCMEDELSEFTPEHFVTVDIAAPEMLCGAPFADRIDVVLDHHRINTVSGKVKFVDPTAASCAEIILDLVELLEVPVDAYLAKTLYTAFATDTGCFRFSNTTARTFRGAALLWEKAEAGELYRINKALFETKSPKRMALEAWAVSHTRVLCKGRAAVLLITRSDEEALGASYEDLDPLVQVIRQMEGVVAAAVIKEREPEEFKVSLRTEEGLDAAEFCRGFSGGGHRAAAGCTLYGKAAEVEKTFLAALEESLK